MIRFLDIQGPNCRETLHLLLHRPLPKATHVCPKKKEGKTRRLQTIQVDPKKFTMFPHQEPCAWYRSFEGGPLTVLDEGT